MFKRILVPLDGSACSQKAFDVALSLARSEQAALEIFSVVDPVVVSWTMPPSQAIDSMLREAEAQARQLVGKAADRAQGLGISAAAQCRTGIPFDEILKAAKRTKADAIVMGTHGRTGLRRMFLGSVAESVLRGSSCPVIVVREKDAETPGAAVSSAAD